MVSLKSFFFSFPPHVCVSSLQSRRSARAEKAKKIAPRPVAGALRPVVRPGGRKYNTRVRAGRGFTLEELKGAGLNPQFARSIGVAVDHRRKNRSEPGFVDNVQRLKQYRARVVLFPKANAKTKRVEKNKKIKHRASKSVSSAEERKNATQLATPLFPVKAAKKAGSAAQGKRVIKPEERLAKNSAYLRARRARADARLVGERKRRAELRAKKAEAAAAGGGKGKKIEVDE